METCPGPFGVPTGRVTCLGDEIVGTYAISTILGVLLAQDNALFSASSRSPTGNPSCCGVTSITQMATGPSR